MFFYVSYYNLCFKVYFVVCKCYYPNFCFSVPFAWNILFHLFTFRLCGPYDLKSVSCRQCIHGSCFLIHSATLSFDWSIYPFIFKANIDRYVFIAILLYIFMVLLLLLLLLLEVPLTFLTILVWWRWTPLAFSCLGSSLFLLHFKMMALLGRVVLVVGPRFSSLWIVHANPFWPEMFLLRN